MSDRRTRCKDHVRAAREWLGRAEASLEQEEHIRGDLNVMLAEAELRRARETGSGLALRHWRRHWLPLAAGLALAAWAGSSTLALRVPAAPEPPAPVPMKAIAPQGVVELSSTSLPASAEPTPALAMEAEGIMRQEEVAAPSPPEESPPVEAPMVRLPSARLQKLMSSAGQSLRAP